MTKDAERQSLTDRIEMLRASVRQHQHLIDLWQRMPDVDERQQERELEEFHRRKGEDEERINRLAERLAGTEG